MRQSRLLRRSTLFFGLTALVKNEDFASGLASYISIDFMFGRGGEIYVHTQISTLVLRTTPITTFAAVVWLLILFCYSISPILQVCAACRHRRLGAHLSRFWVVFDWVLSVYGWMVALLFVADRVWSHDIRARLLDFDNSPHESVERGLREVLTVTSRVAWYTMWLQVLVVYYQLVVLVRFFKASRGQARLAAVVATIQTGIVDIAHLLIVFGLIMSAYVCSGHILFGSRMPEFGTLRAALSECIAMIFKREYEWARFSEEDQFTALMWCWSFLVVNALTLVNLFLAMIFDNYAEIRLVTRDSDTLWRTAAKLFEQVMYFGTWVPNQEVLSAVHGACADQSVTRSQIRKSVPRIPEAQLGRLFMAASRRWEATLLHGNKNIQVEALAGILLILQDITEEIEDARDDADAAVDASPAGSGKFTSDTLQWDPRGEEDMDLLGSPPVLAPRWLKQRLAPHLERHAEHLETIPWHLDMVEHHLKRYGIVCKSERPRSPRRRSAEGEDAWCEDVDVAPPLVPRSRSRGSLSKASTGLESGATLTKLPYGPPPSHLSNFPCGPLVTSIGRAALQAAPKPTGAMGATGTFRTDVRRDQGRSCAKASDVPLFDEPEELVPTMLPE